MPDTWYAVVEGRRPGLYRTWEHCSAQVHGWSRSNFRKFHNIEDARRYLYSRVIIAYTDGSSINNGRLDARAGYAVFFPPALHLDHLNEKGRLNGTEQTNNRAELKALIRACQIAPKDNRPLIICSDSQYAMNTVGVWIDKRRTNGWKNAKGLPVKNDDLIRQLDKEMQERRPRPRLVYVPAHVGFAGNEIADQMAKEAASYMKFHKRIWEEPELALKLFMDSDSEDSEEDYFSDSDESDW